MKRSRRVLCYGAAGALRAGMGAVSKALSDIMEIFPAVVNDRHERCEQIATDLFEIEKELIDYIHEADLD